MNIFVSLPLILLLSLAGEVLGKDNPQKDVTMEQKPFRMGKLNLLWDKAKKRLLNEKLLKLHSELKVQDTEELTFKKLKSAGGDKDGMKEAALRKKLLGIAARYSLSDEYYVNGDDKIDQRKLDKIEFKDKKLNKLWIKAEQSGLTQLELRVLKEEFHHHQDKIEEYHMLITKVDTSNDVNDMVNDIHGFFNVESMEEKDTTYNENINIIRDKHKDLKINYANLVLKSNGIGDNSDFSEPQVVNLWQIALRSDFNGAELESLQEELKHFENKIQKLNHLERNRNKVSVDKYEDLSYEDKEKILRSSSLEGHKILSDRIEKQKRYVEKMQDTLEQKIIARHSEL